MASQGGAGVNQRMKGYGSIEDSGVELLPPSSYAVPEHGSRSNWFVVAKCSVVALCTLIWCTAHLSWLGDRNPAEVAHITTLPSARPGSTADLLVLPTNRTEGLLLVWSPGILFVTLPLGLLRALSFSRLEPSVRWMHPTGDAAVAENLDRRAVAEMELQRCQGFQQGLEDGYVALLSPSGTEELWRVVRGLHLEPMEPGKTHSASQC